jgi:hypothetical protein
MIRVGWGGVAWRVVLRANNEKRFIAQGERSHARGEEGFIAQKASDGKPYFAALRMTAKGKPRTKQKPKQKQKQKQKHSTDPYTAKGRAPAKTKVETKTKAKAKPKPPAKTKAVD